MSDQQPQPSPGRHFATTHWSVVLCAGAAESEVGRKALNVLIEAYWYPLYAYCRRQGNSDHDALDLTQGFFAHFLANDLLATVSPEKGRFRSFLLTCFKNFMSNQRRASGTLRRGGGSTTLSLTTVDFQTHYDREPIDDETPEQIFQRGWVESMLARVRTRLAEDYHRAGKGELFRLLEPHLISGEDALPRAEISRVLNLSAAAIAMSLHRMRRRYGDLLREEVAATVERPEDVDDELRTLMAIAGGRA